MDRRRLLAITGAMTTGAMTRAATVAAVTAAGAGAVAEQCPASAAVKPGVPRRFPVRTGLDRLVETGWATVAGQRVGVISNPTGVDRGYRHLVDLIHTDGRVRVTAVFGPEHGFRGSVQAGGGEGTGVDARTGLTVYDAYGASQNRWAEMYARAEVETLCSISRMSARASTPTSGPCTTRWSPPRGWVCATSYWTAPTRLAAASTVR